MGDMPDLPFDRRRLLVVALGAAVLLVLATRAFPRSRHAAVPPPVRVAHAAVPAKPKLAYVDVVGAVRRPGLYRLPTGARVADAVSRAGGVTRKAELALVNLAALVADGEQVVVPLRGQAAVGASAGGVSAPSGPVHLNSATIEQLDALPGVGPVTAQKIVDYRTAHGAFQSVDELDAISGIGPAKLDQLRGLVVP